MRHRPTNRAHSIARAGSIASSPPALDSSPSGPSLAGTCLAGSCSLFRLAIVFACRLAEATEHQQESKRAASHSSSSRVCHDRGAVSVVEGVSAVLLTSSGRWIRPLKAVHSGRAASEPGVADAKYAPTAAEGQPRQRAAPRVAGGGGGFTATEELNRLGAPVTLRSAWGEHRRPCTKEIGMIISINVLRN